MAVSIPSKGNNSNDASTSSGTSTGSVNPSASSEGSKGLAIAQTPQAPPSVLNPSEVGEMLFNTMVLYGPTGSRKTSQIASFAKYIYETTGKKTRLITMDGGGYGTAQDYVNAGIIDVWRLVEEDKPLPMLTVASQGRWPKDLKNGKRLSTQLAKDNSDVGGYAIEGWFSIANAAMRYLVSKGQKINEDVVSKFIERSDFGEDVSFGAPSRGHYGFVQNFILDIIRNFSGLGVSRILYTSLEGKGEDKISKSLTYGPATAGGAITAAIPQYVGDCIHLEDYQVDLGKDAEGVPRKDTKVRAWFTAHPDPQTNVMWPAKCRIIPSKINAFKSKLGPNGYFNLPQDQENIKPGEYNLYDYLRAQDEVLSAGTKDILEWKNKVDEAKRKLAEGK